MMKLGFTNTALAVVRPQVLERINLLESWDLEPIRAHAVRRMGWTREYACKVEREYRRFIALVVLNRDAQYGMGGDVDEFWHSHLLHTEDYLNMCMDVVGEVVHHRPSLPESWADAGVLNERRLETRAALEHHFGAVDAEVWPDSGVDSQVKCCKHVLPIAMGALSH